MSSQVQAQTPSAYDARTGAIAVSGQPVFIARERDFQEFMTDAPAGHVHVLKSALQTELRKQGERRTPVTDLLRLRLRQLRGSLAAFA